MAGTHKNVFVEPARLYTDCHNSLNGQRKLTIHTYVRTENKRSDKNEQ